MATVKNLIKRLIGHSLYTNALWLMINSVVLSGFGFFFWTIVVRLYSVVDVGLASTLISSLELISNLSLIGFNIALIRYLPKSRQKSQMVSSCFVLSGLIALLIGILFVFGLNVFSPKLIFLKNIPLYGVLFVVFVISYVLFTLIEPVFISMKGARFVLVKNSIFSLLKLVFPFLLIFLGAFGIFSSMALSAAIAFFVSLIFLKLKLSFTIKKSTIKKMFKFSLGNYIANTLQYAPGYILPLIITNLINPETTAYFYVAYMLGGMLYIIPSSISISLLAEGSHEAKNVHEKVKKAFKFSYLLLVPSVLVMVILGKYLLLLFGTEYSNNAFRFLQIFAISALFFAINIIYISKKNIQHKVKDVVFVYLLIAGTILVLSYMLLDLGLIGVGIAWLAGQLVGNCFVVIDTIRGKNE